MTDKKQIFLSYGRGDDQALVEEIATKINKDTGKTGFSAWYDKFNLPSATQFTDEIAKAIEDSYYFVFFIGDHSLKSEWCEREWKHALKECVPIIPVLVNVGWDDKRVEALPKQIRRKNGTIADSMTVDELVEWIIKQSGYDYTITQPIGISAFPKHFVERPQYIDDIKVQLRVGDPTDISKTNVVGITAQAEMGALRGMSGIGKSTLAKAVCYDCEVQMTYDHIFFLEVNQTNKVIEHELEATGIGLFRSIGFWLGDKTEEIEAYKQLQTARGRIQDLLKDKRTLIVLDDVWRKDIINLFTWEKVHLLITTRNRELIPSAHLVNTLTLEEGGQLFRLLFVISERVPTDITSDHRAILTFLDGHTLAIEIAGKWLIKYHTKKSPADYLAMLQSSEAELFKHLDMRDSDIDRNDKLERSIALSYTMLVSDDDRARFRALGMFAPNTTFSQDALNELWDLSDAFLDATTLTEVGLLEYDDKTMRYSQHPLLRAYALKLLHDYGEYDVIFGRYADFYIQRAKAIFALPLEQWDDNIEGSQNTHDVTNIKYLGEELIHRTQNGTTGDLHRAFYFGVFTKLYVHERLEAKAWNWLEMGIIAAEGWLKLIPNNADLIRLYTPMVTSISLIYHYLGENDKALDYYNQALTICREIEDKEGETTALRGIGSIYHHLGENDKALDYYNQALTICREIEDKADEATTLSGIGLIYHHLGVNDKALDYYNQALSIFHMVGDRHSLINILTNISFIHYEVGDADKVLDKLQLNLLLCRVKGNKGGEASIINNIAGIHYTEGDMNKALDYYNQALPIFRAVGDKQGEAMTLNNIGKIYAVLDDKDKSLNYYNQALPIFRAVGDSRGEATVLGNIGALYFFLDEMDKSLNYYNQALPIFHAMGDKHGELSTAGNIGEIYRILGKMQKAMEHQLQALMLARELEDNGGEATALNNIGALYFSLGEMDSSLAYLQQSLMILHTVRDIEKQILTLTNIGKVYDALNQSADKEFTIRIASYMVAQQVHTALLLCEVGRLNEAIEHAQQALTLMREKGLLHDSVGTKFAQVEQVLYTLKRKRGDVDVQLDILDKIIYLVITVFLLIWILITLPLKLVLRLLKPKRNSEVK